MNIPAVRQALADVLAEEFPEMQVSAYVLAQPTPPGIQIPPPGRVYNFAVGFDEWTFIVQAFCSLTSDIGAQKMLDDVSMEMQGALEADRTLGGLVGNLTVLDQSPGRQVEQPPGNPMLLIEWRLTIYAG